MGCFRPNVRLKLSWTSLNILLAEDIAEPDIVKYDKNNKLQYDLILGVKTMKKYGIILDFKDKMITVDEVKLPMQNINYLQNSSTLPALGLTIA